MITELEKEDRNYQGLKVFKNPSALATYQNRLFIMCLL